VGADQGGVLALGREVLQMTWVMWTVIGIGAFFVVLFVVSCAVLNRVLDHDDDDKGDWY